jgi:hypothetical protein
VEVTNVREKIERKCSAKLEETHTIRKLELVLQNQILTPTSNCIAKAHPPALENS